VERVETEARCGPERAGANVRRSRWASGTAVALLVGAISTTAERAAGAAELQVVSTTTFESGGKKFLQPCVHNAAGETRTVHVRIGNGVMRWAYPPLTIPAKKTLCFTFDAPPLHAGVEQHRVEVAAER
jgi:hypothetical protein